MANFFKKIFGAKKKNSRQKDQKLGQLEKSLKRLGGGVRTRLGKNMQGFNLETVGRHSNWFRWGLVVLGIFLAAELTTRILGNIVKPKSTPRIGKMASTSKKRRVLEDYQSISNRNIFNVDGTIPPPWEKDMLDCLSQATASRGGLKLLGTIVMKDAIHSVALIESNGKINAVKIEDSFGNGKYVAQEIQRKKLCFTNQTTKDYEFIEIRDDVPGLGVTGGPQLGGATSQGIEIISQNERSIEKSWLEGNLKNLNDILQTARAVPHIDATGQFKGFLVQSMQPDSPFLDLGIQQGDVLTSVNEIVLDNAGKGLEAFDALRNTNQITLEVLRGGQKQTLNFNIR